MRAFLFFLLLIFSILLLSAEKENGNKTLNLTENKKVKDDKGKKENELSNSTINKTANKNSFKTRKEESNKTGNNTSFKPLNKTSNKTHKENPKKKKPKRKPVVSPLESSPSFGNSDPNEITNKDVYSLNDLNFDIILQQGNNYKWLVILYSQTCGHCLEARRAIRKILSHYRNSTKVRFGEIEITRNLMTYMRFEVDMVPYIFLLQNNSIYELDLYPNEKNLKEFIETDFKSVTEDLKPLPPMVPFHKVGWEVGKNVVRVITNGINEMLYDAGYEIEFTPLTLFLSIISFFGSICFLQYFCCLKFCPDNDENKEKEKEGDKEEKKENEEDDKEKEENVNKIEGEDNNGNKEITEKEKIKREKEKEKENKKIKKEAENKNINKDEKTKIKKAKKKKKE